MTRFEKAKHDAEVKTMAMDNLQFKKDIYPEAHYCTSDGMTFPCTNANCKDMHKVAIEHEIAWLEEDTDELIKEATHSLPHRKDMCLVLDMDKGHLADILKLAQVLWTTGYLGNITPNELENRYSNFCKERFGKNWVTFEYQNTQHLCDDFIDWSEEKKPLDMSINHNASHEVSYPEDVAIIAQYLQTYGDVDPSGIDANALENLYHDFSEDKYEAGWMMPHDDILQQFSIWLENRILSGDSISKDDEEHDC